MNDMESILLSIKKMLGPAGTYDAFDPDIIMHINSAFMVLHQLGVGPSEGFFIEDDSSIWSDYLADPMKLHGVKTYMYAKVKLVFDPPSSSAHMQALKDTVNEFEWRLNVAVDPTESQ